MTEVQNCFEIDFNNMYQCREIQNQYGEYPARRTKWPGVANQKANLKSLGMHSLDCKAKPPCL